MPIDLIDGYKERFNENELLFTNDVNEEIKALNRIKEKQSTKKVKEEIEYPF